MTKSKPPPIGDCIVDAMIAIDGDNWARVMIDRYPGLQWHAVRQAGACINCANALKRLYPNGLPESHNPDDYNPPGLSELLQQIREDTGQDIL